MVEKGHQIAFRRDARMADPAGRLVENLPDRKFQAFTAVDVADDGEAAAVGRPIRPKDVFQNVAGRAASGHAHPRERAARLEGSDDVSAERKGHLAGPGDAEDVGAGQPERA